MSKNQSPQKKRYPRFLNGFEIGVDTVVWRYFDFEKFRSFLETRSLYFSAAEQFDDKFEGSISYPYAYRRGKSNIRTLGSDPGFIRQVEQSTSKAFKELRRLVKISCWHQNDFESAAMWKLYLKEGKGIVVRSTVDRLVKSLGVYKIKPSFGEENIWIGAVKYIDFERDPMETDMLGRFFFKRKSFAYENELRVAISLRLAEEFGVQVPEKGILVPVDLYVLIEEIRVAPELDSSFVDEIRRLIKASGLQIKIQQSDMDKDPIF